MEGFIVFDHVKEYPAARKQLAQWLAAGKIKRQETIVKGGLKVAEQALDNLFKGGNTGEYSRTVTNDCCNYLSRPMESPELSHANASRKTFGRGQISGDEEQALIGRVRCSPQIVACCPMLISAQRCIQPSVQL